MSAEISNDEATVAKMESTYGEDVPEHERKAHPGSHTIRLGPEKLKESPSACLLESVSYLAVHFELLGHLEKLLFGDSLMQCSRLVMQTLKDLVSFRCSAMRK